MNLLEPGRTFRPQTPAPRHITNAPETLRSTAPQVRPRLLFMQSRYEHDTPRFLLAHKDEHVRCLSRFFEVTVVNHDCDFAHVCDQHRPDLVLFETGVELQKAHRLRIRNLGAFRGIPRVALANTDGCSELRTSILSDLDHWDVEALFSISAVAPEYLSCLPIPLYIWPNAVDPGLHHDRRLPKSITVLVTGARSARYPWRMSVFPAVTQCYATLDCPHGGYSSQAAAAHMLHGEAYARTLNMSVFAPTCGSVTRELVRKHLEIPANRACLITEPSHVLIAAGFQDMVNCVFGQADEVIDKVAHLLHNPDELARITQRGHDLVHAQHTFAQRDQIHRWFLFRRQFGVGTTIAQPQLIGPLIHVPEAGTVTQFSPRSASVHLALLHAADAHFRAGRWSEAEPLYHQSLAYLSEFPEAKVKIACCKLHQGDAGSALEWITQPLRCSLRRYGAEDPDPVEWACLLVCLLCLGRVHAAIRRSRQFPALRHVQLDGVRGLLRRLCGIDAEALSQQRERASIHELFGRLELQTMLRACGRDSLAAAFGAPPGSRARFHWQLAACLPLCRRRANLAGLDNPLLWRRIKARTVSLAHW